MNTKTNETDPRIARARAVRDERIAKERRETEERERENSAAEQARRAEIARRHARAKEAARELLGAYERLLDVFDQVTSLRDLEYASSALGACMRTANKKRGRHPAEPQHALRDAIRAALWGEDFEVFMSQ